MQLLNGSPIYPYGIGFSARSVCETFLFIMLKNGLSGEDGKPGKEERFVYWAPK